MLLWIVTQEGKNGMRGAVSLIKADTAQAALKQFKKSENYSESKKDAFAPQVHSAIDGFNMVI